MSGTGRFIALYGVNGTGKTVQRERLTKRLEEEGISVMSIKYPIYDLAPSGQIINSVLREGLEMEAYDFQTHCARNRFAFQPTLLQALSEGRWVVAEDYTQTGIIWGQLMGLTKNAMEDMNRGLVRPDLEILLDGQPFSTGVERSHILEGQNELSRRARAEHLRVARQFRWPIVDSTRSEREVSEDIWNIVTGVGFK